MPRPSIIGQEPHQDLVPLLGDAAESPPIQTKFENLRPIVLKIIGFALLEQTVMPFQAEIPIDVFNSVHFNGHSWVLTGVSAYSYPSPIFRLVHC